MSFDSIRRAMAATDHQLTVRDSRSDATKTHGYRYYQLTFSLIEMFDVLNNLTRSFVMSKLVPVPIIRKPL